MYGNFAPNSSYTNVYHPANLDRVTYTCTTNPVFNPASSPGCISDDPLLLADHTLTPGQSPCIDQGNDAIVNWPTDLAGNDRKIDGDEDTVVTVDMGAYEAEPPAAGGTIFLFL